MKLIFLDALLNRQAIRKSDFFCLILLAAILSASVVDALTDYRISGKPLCYGIMVNEDPCIEEAEHNNQGRNIAHAISNTFKPSTSILTYMHFIREA